MAALSLPLAPDFILPDLEFTEAGTGHSFRSHEQMGKTGLLLGIICNHCPYVIHIAPTLSKVLNALQELGYGAVLVSANDPIAYPQDSPERMREWASHYSISVPYAFDADQSQAKALFGSCTPEFTLFSTDGKCIYRGRFDESNHKNGLQATGSDLLNAAKAWAGGKNPENPFLPSTGCSIKWKPGNEPEY
jgi:hypothetical protein